MLRKVNCVIFIFVLALFLFKSETYATMLDDKNIKCISYDSLIEAIDSNDNILAQDIDFIITKDNRYIDVSQLKHFENWDEVEEYARLQRTTVEYQNSLRSTVGDVVVDQVNIGIANGAIKLHVSYVTSGNGNTGTIISQSAYTSFSGFTFGFDWSETNCYSYITSSGKDIYANATGELTYYLVVGGYIQIYDQEVNLSGYANVIH